jgi:uncharacterized protein (TIGR03083 family)
MEHWATIAAERLALADDVEGLTAEQWDTGSLCGDWRVRDVIGHLVTIQTTSWPALLIEIAKARGDFDKANSRMAVREGQRPPADLVAGLRRVADGRFKPPGYGSEAPLTDILVHGYDVRLPLGLPTDRPTEPFRHVLDLLVTPKGKRGFLPKALPPLRFVATDLDWSHGEGDEVSGPAADLTLGMTGRGFRDSLSGSGQGVFAEWCRAA